MEVLSSCFQH